MYIICIIINLLIKNKWINNSQNHFILRNFNSKFIYLHEYKQIGNYVDKCYY